jgi:hypothetical protein
MLVCNKRKFEHIINIHKYYKRTKITPNTQIEITFSCKKRPRSPEPEIDVSQHNIPRYKTNYIICNEHTDKPHLVVSEIEQDVKIHETFKYKPYISPSLWASFIDGPDPRDFYATDIQRIYRGWITRKRTNYKYYNSIILVNSLVALRL